MGVEDSLRQLLIESRKENEKLKEELRDAKAQSRVNDQHRMLYQHQRNEARDKLNAILKALNTPNTGDEWFVQEVIRIMNLQMEPTGWEVIDDE